MTAKKQSDHARDTLPRREVVEVFRTLHLEDADEVRRLEELGGFGQVGAQQAVYYTIEVTGTHECPDYALSI